MAKVEYDHSRPSETGLSDATGYPILIDGEVAIYAVDDYVDTKLSETAITIAQRNRSYTLKDAVVWAAQRAVDRTGIKSGVVRSDRTDVN